MGLHSSLHGGVFGVQVMALASRASASTPRKMVVAFILKFDGLILGVCVRECAEWDIEVFSTMLVGDCLHYILRSFKGAGTDAITSSNVSPIPETYLSMVQGGFRVSVLSV